MSQIIIDDLDDETLGRLSARASSNGRSIEEEVKAILREHATVDMYNARSLAVTIVERFRTERRTFSDSAELIREAGEA